MRLHHRQLVLAVCLACASTLADAEEKTLPVITVHGSAQSAVRPLLRDDIIATESLPAERIGRTGAVMLTEALDKQPGITVQTECSICNVRNVVLNNLPGRFTTLMLDGVPIFSSVSSAYGLDSVGMDGLERIDIARGAGASLIAPEALAGVVNLVTRRPKENRTIVSQSLGDFGSAVTSAYLARDFGDQALSLSLNHNQHDSVDADGNGISEYTGFRRNLGGLSWFADNAGGYRVRARLDLVDEKRGGGALGRDYSAIKASTSGNPFDWSRGPAGSPDARGWVVADGSGPNTLSNGANGVFYDGGRGGMSEIIFTKRSQFVATGERPLGEGKLRLALGYAQHRQDSYYETDTYKADQTQYYLETTVQQPFGQALVTAGLNYRYEDLISTGFGNGGTTPNDGIDNYTYRTPAAFLQAYRAMLDDRLEVNGSVRFDRHNVFGNIVSPRLNALYHHSDEISSRFALGKGFRAPTSFFEQDHGILNTLRIDRRISQPEISHNASYALSYAGDRWAWSGSANWNRIFNMALLDPNATDASGNPVTVFTSATNPVTVAGLDFTLTHKLTPTLELTAAAETFRYKFDPGTLVFARPEERLYFRADWDVGDWTLFARATWTGTMDLRRFYDYGGNPRYNFDGTPKRDRSPSFWVADLRAEYRVNKTLSAYLGVDNLFDFNQSDHESMLWVNASGRIDVTHIWGPNRGRFIYGGVRISL